MDTTQMKKKITDALDTNKDGKISKEEVVNMLNGDGFKMLLICVFSIIVQSISDDIILFIKMNLNLADSNNGDVITFLIPSLILMYGMKDITGKMDNEKRELQKIILLREEDIRKLEVVIQELQIKHLNEISKLETAVELKTQYINFLRDKHQLPKD